MAFRGSANGIAKKGKTKGTMVKMAAGGVAGKPASVGLDRAAAMSGRTMPVTGRKRGGKC